MRWGKVTSPATLSTNKGLACIPMPQGRGLTLGLVTGAGFGMLATESVVLKLCQDRPTPDRVRTDALASVEIEEG